MPLIGIGQLDADLGHMRVAQQVGVQLGGGLRDQEDADIDARQLRRRGPFQERDQIDAFLDARARLLGGRDQLLGEIDDQRDAFPLAVVLGHLEKKAR